MARKITKKPNLNREIRQVLENTAEVKRLQFIDNTNTISNTGTVVNISNNIVQGDDISTRTGNQVRALRQWLYVRFTAITDSQSARIIWFKDNTNRGTTPAVTELLQSATITSPYAPASMQQHRFTIFKDFTLNCSLNGELIKSAEYMHNKRHMIYYNGAAAVASANGPGATFILIIGNVSTGQWDAGAEIQYLDA